MTDKNKTNAAGSDEKKLNAVNNGNNDVIKAHNEADKDISTDPDLTAGSPHDDLDEGESARLGEDTSGII